MNQDTESILFTAKSIGNVAVANRFVRSATFECAANEDGSVGDKYSKIYERLSKGKVGLIISGMMHISEPGKSYQFQAGLHSDEMIPGLSKMTKKVHQAGSKIFAQIAHGGRQTLVQGRRPMAPSGGGLDFIYQVIPRPMTIDEIKAVIADFGNAALRAKQAGFDGVQVHGAHGYLIHEFLSPFFNHRSDEWGGNANNRFRFLKCVYESVREKVGDDFPVIIKLNVNDHTPQKGLSIEEVKMHCERLAEMGIDAVELSCGTLAYSMFNQSRGDVPAKGFSSTLPLPFQWVGARFFAMVFPQQRYIFEEGYNLWASRHIRKVMPDVPLIMVGGLRSPDVMANIIQQNQADFVSMCRPLIREPMIIKKWQDGNKKPVSCVNCNKCFVVLAHNEVLSCGNNRTF
ncbi:MAG: NADH:flavin oxidoreductase [Desulfobacteraceae bacterium]|nr:NADH:flavin oxidoreductase [Desulfobacteraceae bacterium]